MAKLPSKTSPCLIFLFMAMIINQSSSARTLENPTPSTDHHRQNHHHHHNHHKITFLMRDIFNITTKSSTTKFTSPTTHNNKLPFPKPLGLFPPKGAVPLPETNSNPATTGSSSAQTLDLPGIGLSFPAKATLQELELGIVTSIEEDIFHPLGYETYGSQLLGKAQGMRVASSEDGSSHMMALTVKFAHNNNNNNNKGNGDQVENGLRFFGVKRSDVNESHIAVIGGIGKYQGANGYATVKVVNVRSSSVLREEKGAEKLLKFTVYLS